MKHPMQDIIVAEDGVVRFRKNKIVRFLLDWATPRGMSLNDLARMDFDDADREQLAQLIGYSVSGFGDLSYASEETVAKADVIAESVLAAHREKPTSPP